MVVKKNHVMIILGTRPEVIKCAPVIKELEQRRAMFKSTVVVTGQHRQLLDQMLAKFSIKPDIDLDLMSPNQSLETITAYALLKLAPCIKARQPDIILVQGDTTTSLVGALAGFYQKIPVAHIEAGLRTYNNSNPYPEEFNRHTIDRIASWHFAATKSAEKNLLREGIGAKTILVTGNTVIDSVHSAYQADFNLSPWIKSKQRFVLITMHRRESYGRDFIAILEAINLLLNAQPNYKFIFPVHPNPKVKQAINKVFKKKPKNLCLMPSLDYNVFINLLAKAQLVITDSGGIQEEITALGVPAIICRSITERPEALSSGAYLIAPDKNRIYKKALSLLSSKSKLRPKHSPYGDGQAAKRIVDMLSWIFGQQSQRPKPFRYMD